VFAGMHDFDRDDAEIFDPQVGRAAGFRRVFHENKRARTGDVGDLDLIAGILDAQLAMELDLVAPFLAAVRRMASVGVRGRSSALHRHVL
jgi:hypothetical protein